MSGNFIMISEEDLEKAFTKMLEKYLSTHQLAEKSSTEEDKYLSSDEACDYMHVTPSTLWRMRQRGEIVVHKVGGRCLYSKNDLDTLINKG
ncbi:MAG: helix-turn-helix domain-containing protein [Bacteroidaceae bacterium]|nr:helix-turn-helix domain-containing protein [Bacteroidaceae bacterium]